MHTPTHEICRVTIFPSTEPPLVRRIRAEFREMPGMRLTAEQARRLWSLDGATCGSALDHLTMAGFLVRDESGRYHKAHGGY